MDRPLAAITRTDVRERHEKLTDDNGIYLANRVMRHLRAAWNTLAKEHELPVCPTIAVHWNKEHRRQEPIPWVELPGWFKRSRPSNRSSRTVSASACGPACAVTTTC